MRQLFKVSYKIFLIFLNLAVGIGVAFYLLMRFKGRLTKKTTKQHDMLATLKNSSDAKKSLESKPEKKKIQSKKKEQAPEAGNRLDEVFGVIKKNKEVDMAKLLTEIKGVTERTLRRDLLKLQNMKLIVKEGTTKSAKYKHIVR